MARTNRGVETLVATCTAAAMCAGVWLLDHGTDRRDPPPPPVAETPAGESEPLPERTSRPTVGLPFRIRVPSIGVHAPLTGLGLARDGSLATPPPEEAGVAGWYEKGTVPGDVGTALIAGHVDTASGPAVFYRLGVLKKGATVAVDRRDGLTATFTVDAVEVHKGSDFPDQKVYGPASRPELRLITCGGGYDEKAGEYLGNVVVFAHLTGVQRTARDAAGSDPRALS